MGEALVRYNSASCELVERTCARLAKLGPVDVVLLLEPAAQQEITVNVLKMRGGHRLLLRVPFSTTWPFPEILLSALRIPRVKRVGIASTVDFLAELSSLLRTARSRRRTSFVGSAARAWEMDQECADVEPHFQQEDVLRDPVEAKLFVVELKSAFDSSTPSKRDDRKEQEILRRVGVPLEEFRQTFAQPCHENKWQLQWACLKGELLCREAGAILHRKNVWSDALEAWKSTPRAPMPATLRDRIYTYLLHYNAFVKVLSKPDRLWKEVVDLWVLAQAFVLDVGAVIQTMVQSTTPTAPNVQIEVQTPPALAADPPSDTKLTELSLSRSASFASAPASEMAASETAVSDDEAERETNALLDAVAVTMANVASDVKNTPDSIVKV
eukprot:TRINITY_DN10132_c0_g1_i1.p1 TRINITY_DN10132_c0_g1~~TRINITY_DN10132_c0_g1_i1.p1  ORF type:complete len:384 (+),score=40.27 TRINITY_DN10132_c0_g1_i1:96-1247(+)